MKTLLTVLVALALPLLAQLKDAGPRHFGPYTVATLPAAASYSGYEVTVIDGATADSCISGGGSFKTKCRSNGTIWEAIGGGTTSVSGLTDLLATRTSGTVVAVAAGNQVIGNTSTSILAQTVTLTGGSGNGTCFVYVTEGAAPVTECPTSAGLTGTFLPSGVFQSATTPAVPANSRYLADIIVVGGAITSVIDRRGLGPIRPIFAGDGVVVTDVGGVATIARDPATIPCYGCTNPFTSLVDVSAGIFTQPFGNGTPSGASCDAVGEVGRVYVNYANGGLAYDCMQTGSGVYGWVSRGGSNTWDPATTYRCHDELEYSAIASSASQGPCDLQPGVNMTFQAGETTAAGIVRLTTTTSSTGIAGWFAQNTATSFGAAEYTSISRIRITTLSDGTETFETVFGYADTSTITPVDGCYFRYSHTVNSGKFEAVCRSNSVETGSTLDTGIAVVAGTWYTLKAVVNAAATSVQFFINGTSVGTITANIPTGGGSRVVGWHPAMLLKSAGTTARTVDVDYVAQQVVYAVAR